MFKGLMVGFSWGVLVALMGTLVLSLATTRPDATMPDGAAIPQIAERILTNDPPDTASVAEPSENLAAPGDNASDLSGLEPTYDAAVAPAVDAEIAPEPTAETTLDVVAAPELQAPAADAIAGLETADTETPDTETAAPTPPAVSDSLATVTPSQPSTVSAADPAPGTIAAPAQIQAPAGLPEVPEPQLAAQDIAPESPAQSADAQVLPPLDVAETTETSVATPNLVAPTTPSQPVAIVPAAPELAAPETEGNPSSILPASASVEEAGALALDLPVVVAEPVLTASGPTASATHSIARAEPAQPEAPSSTPVIDVAVSDAPAPDLPQSEPVAQLASVADPTFEAEIERPAAIPAPSALAPVPQTPNAPGVADAPSVQTALPDSPTPAQVSPEDGGAGPVASAAGADDGAGSGLPRGFGTSLPQVSRFGLSTETDAARESETAEPPAPVEAAVELPALQANGASFENPGARPLLAIVLRATPGQEIDINRITGINFPVSVALDADLSSPGDQSARLQQSGVDVLVDIGPLMGPGFEARLAEATLSVPYAVGFIDVAGASVQADRAATDAVLAQMAESGHGLVAVPSGFNTGIRVAARDGLNAAILQRDIPEGSAVETARILDRAAFVAGQQGGAVVVAPASETMISAITAWALGDRSEAVALAPVSAVLMSR